MRKLIVVLALSGCAFPTSPAKVGMSIAEYDKTCPAGETAYTNSGVNVIGQCTFKPEEFVIFEGGTLREVHDHQSFLVEALEDCGSDPKCEQRAAEEINQAVQSKIQRARRLELEHWEEAEADQAAEPQLSNGKSYANDSCQFNHATGRYQRCVSLGAEGACLSFGRSC